MRFVRGFRTLAGLLAVIFIIVTVTLFVIFPRAANQLADLLGTGAEHPIHWLPAIIFDVLLLILAYFWIWRPWRTFTYVQEGQGLVVQKGQGRAYIDAESVRHQVYAAVTKVSNVRQVEVAIDNELGRAVVRANILTDNDINGPRKKQEISREIKKVVQDQFGVRLAGEPIINLRLTPLEGVPPAPPLEPLPIRRDRGAAPAAVTPPVVIAAPIVAEPVVLPKANPEPLQSGVNSSEPAPFKRRAFVADTSASTAPTIPPAPPIHLPAPEPVVETVSIEPPAAETAPTSNDDAELAALMAQLNQSSSVVNTEGTPADVTPPASPEPVAEVKPSLDALATDTISNADSGSSNTADNTDSSTDSHTDPATGQPFVRRRFVPPTAKSDGNAENS